MTTEQWADGLLDDAPTPNEAFAADLPSGFRPDIEGLRAIAVVVVLLYHAHLGPFHGGFLGVDVFFVISGYLITALLMKDLLVRGGRALPRFWGRRARRLLPASLTVMVVTLIAGRFMLDPLKQIDLGHDALWASAFIINIRFAMGDSYSVAQTTPTPLLHFWSLAVEEQFYVIWPFLLYTLTKVRWRTRGYAIAIAAGFFVESLLAWLWLSNWARTPAFFLLPTRAWELIAGALLALVGGKVLRISPTVRAGAGWAGLFLIGYSVLRFDDTTNLGLWALVPVLGTVAVIGAAGPGHRNEPAWLLSNRPMVWIGKRSYGIYLWHWPALVLFDAKFGPLSTPARVGILVGATGMAAVSYRYLENPVRESRWLAVAPRRSLLMGAGLVCAGVLASTLMIHLPRDLGGGGVVAAPTLPGLTGTTSPSAMSVPGSGSTASTSTAVTSSVSGTTTSTIARRIVPLAQLVAAQRTTLDKSALITKVPSNATPPLYAVKGDKPSIYGNGCVLADGTTDSPPCLFGDVHSSTTVTLFGDSHAAQWFPALELMASSYHWKLEVLVKRGCPTADVRIKRTYLDPECVEWRRKVVERLAASHPHLLIVASTAYDPGGSDVGLDSDTVWHRGLEKTLSEVRPSADQLLIIGDTPLPAHEVPNCLTANPRNVRYCGAQRSKAIDVSRLQLESDLATQHNGTFVSVSDWLCGTSACPTILGNIIMWRDNNHISATMSKYLEPLVESVVAPIMLG
jgi:peptidoglycan/LPS O-acetylase OafA/YrhL